MEKLFLLLVATAFLVSCDQAPKEAPINPKMDVFNTNVASTKAFLSSFMENDSVTFFSDKYIGKDATKYVERISN